MLSNNAWRSVLLLLAVLSLAAKANAASIGLFQIQNDPTFGLGPIFEVTNESSTSGFYNSLADFSNVHLIFDLLDNTQMDFLLADTVAGAGGFVQTDTQPLPDLSTVLDAYITLTIIDPTTLATIAGTVSLGQTADTSACPGCVTTMTDFTDLNTMSINFDPATPTSVPEPATVFLVGSGLAVCALKRRRAR